MGKGQGKGTGEGGAETPLSVVCTGLFLGLFVGLCILVGIMTNKPMLGVLAVLSVLPGFFLNYYLAHYFFLAGLVYFTGLD